MSMPLPVNPREVVAVIPARIGSKRLPKKNLRECFGMSLLERAYRFARDLGVDIVISTDSAEVIYTALDWPCTRRYTRDPYLHSDDCKSLDVWLDAWDKDKHRYSLLLEPSSPNRTYQDAYQCLELLNNHTKAMTVSAFPNKILQLSSEGLQPTFSDPCSGTGLMRYRPTGCVYALRNDFEGGVMDNSQPVVIDRLTANIDTMADLQLAEFLLFREHLQNQRF